MANDKQSAIKVLGQKSKQGAESGSVALTIIVTWLLTDVFKINVPVEVAVAISTFVGILASRLTGHGKAQADAAQTGSDKQ